MASRSAEAQAASIAAHQSGLHASRNAGLTNAIQKIRDDNERKQKELTELRAKGMEPQTIWLHRFLDSLGEMVQFLNQKSNGAANCLEDGARGWRNDHRNFLLPSSVLWMGLRSDAPYAVLLPPMPPGTRMWLPSEVSPEVLQSIGEWFGAVQGGIRIDLNKDSRAVSGALERLEGFERVREAHPGFQP